jgi:hypothetical protein
MNMQDMEKPEASDDAISGDPMQEIISRLDSIESRIGGIEAKVGTGEEMESPEVEQTGATPMASKGAGKMDFMRKPKGDMMRGLGL